MIRVVNGSGPAEGATSPGHGSNNTGKETAVNDQHDTTANGGAARAPFNWQGAYEELYDPIGLARARMDVLCLLSDSLSESTMPDGGVRLPRCERNALLFMIEEVREAIETIDKSVADKWDAVRATVLDNVELGRQIKAQQERDEDMLGRLIVTHIAALNLWKGALEKGLHEPEGASGPTPLEAETKAKHDAALEALLSWQPITARGNEGRLQYLLHDPYGYRNLGKLSEAQLHTLFASARGIQHA